VLCIAATGTTEGTDKGMDSGTDTGTDKGVDGRWLTYSELAAIRCIDRHSAVKLVTRHRWRRQKDNRGILRIFVPLEWAGTDKGTDSATDRDTDKGMDFAEYVAAYGAAMEGQISALQAVIEAKDGQISALLGQVEGYREQASANASLIDTLGFDLNKARAELAQMRDDLAEARAEAWQAQDETGDLRDRLAAAEQAADLVRAEAQEAQDTAEALRSTNDELWAGQAMMVELHAGELAAAEHDALAAQQAAAKAEARTVQAEQGEEAERSRADAINALLEATQEELAGQWALTDAARQDAQAVQEWAAGLRQAETPPTGRRGASWRGSGRRGGGDDRVQRIGDVDS
jgi:hypothetical protein